MLFIEALSNAGNISILDVCCLFNVIFLQNTNFGSMYKRRLVNKPGPNILYPLSI